MPIQYVIEPECGLVVVRLWEELSGGEMVRCARALLSDAAYAAGAPLLIDMSALKKMNAGGTDFMVLGELQTRYVTEHQKRSRLAILAPNDLGYAFGRMYHGFSDDAGQEYTKLCADPAEAAEWLGVALPIIEATQSRAASRAQSGNGSD